MPRLTKSAAKEKHDDVFAEVMSRTNSPAKAMIAAEPKLADNKAYASVKANRMLKRTDIQDKIQEKLEKQAKKALKNVDDMLLSDNEQIKFANTWKVLEHVRGKPLARNLNLNASMSIEDALTDV